LHIKDIQQEGVARSANFVIGWQFALELGMKVIVVNDMPTACLYRRVIVAIFIILSVF
jgi:hypothetical protein